MTDWADYAIGRLEKQRQDQRLKDQKFVEKQRIKKAHGIPLWRQIRQIIKDNCSALNTKVGKEMLVFEVTQDREVSVRAHLDSDVRRLHALFDEETGKLSWECGEKSGDWEVAVTDEGGAQFQWGMIPTVPTSIVKQMLDALLFD